MQRDKANLNRHFNWRYNWRQNRLLMPVLPHNPEVPHCSQNRAAQPNIICKIFILHCAFKNGSHADYWHKVCQVYGQDECATGQLSYLKTFPKRYLRSKDVNHLILMWATFANLNDICGQLIHCSTLKWASTENCILKLEVKKHGPYFYPNSS